MTRQRLGGGPWSGEGDGGDRESGGAGEGAGREMGGEGVVGGMIGRRRMRKYGGGVSVGGGWRHG